MAKDSTSNVSSKFCKDAFGASAFCASYSSRVHSVKAITGNETPSLVSSDNESEVEVGRKPVRKPGLQCKLVASKKRKKAVEVMCGCARLNKELNTARFEEIHHWRNANG